MLKLSIVLLGSLDIKKSCNYGRFLVCFSVLSVYMTTSAIEAKNIQIWLSNDEWLSISYGMHPDIYAGLVSGLRQCSGFIGTNAPFYQN